jgi:hypothetical protein
MVHAGIPGPIKVMGRLLLAVFVHVSLGGMVGMIPSVKRVSPCGVCMVGRFLVLSAFMVFRGFSVVACGIGVMFC